MTDSDFALLLNKLDLTTPRAETRGAMKEQDVTPPSRRLRSRGATAHE